MTFKNQHFLQIAIVICFSVTVAIILTSISLDENSTGSFETPTISESIEFDGPNLALRDSLELFGKDLLGIPYSYAGTSREGFDCSGFVYYVFNNFDIEVPRSSSQFANFGEDVAIDQVQKGDILVFLSPTRNEIGHLGIVTNPKGMDSEFIHASSGKEMQVIISSLKQPGYNRRFIKAVSVLKD